MKKFTLGRVSMTLMILVAFLVQGTWALAGTTGGLSGVVTDQSTGAPIAGAKVIASSPSGTASTTTDNSGHFDFLTLAPDSYTVSIEKDGYQPTSQAGVTVFADQTQRLGIHVQKALKEIARVSSRAAGNLVKAGTTADVYSVNATTQQVVGSSGGGFNLNNAYSAIYSQPGVTSYLGNAGWGQVFYIRGSAYSQVGYEYDGVPVNRAFDNYQANSLSNLGQQELQVYTGGSPSGASSATLGGFINQVIKTGTYPGFGTAVLGLGAPGFYHSAKLEAGGSNPDRTFSYYAAVNGYNQSFPAGSWTNLSNIASNGMNAYGLASGFEIATPVSALSPTFNSAGLMTSNAGAINANVPDASITNCNTLGINCGWSGQWTNGPWAPCQENGVDAGEPIGYSAANPGPFNGTCLGYFPFNTSLANIFERNSVVNLHFAIPHKRDSGRDDIQLLYNNSSQYQLNGDAMNDAGGIQHINNLLTPFAPLGTTDVNGINAYNGPYQGLCGYENQDGLGCAVSGNSPIPYLDTKIFAPGTSFGEPVANAKTAPYYFPNSPTNRALNTPFSPTVGEDPGYRDGFQNDVGIVKVQYTKNLSSNAYARLFGYSFYSDWLIGAQPAAGTCYIDGFLCAPGGPGWYGTADYELTTHTRGAEFQFADQINPKNLIRFTANYTTASVARWNNSSWEAGYAGSRTGIANLTNGDPNNPICYSYKTGAQASCYSSNSYGTPQDPMRTSYCSSHTCAATPAGASWLVTVPGGQGTYNTVRPKFTNVALEDEFRPTDRLDLNLGVRFENYEYDLNNMDTPENNFWFNATAQVVCFDPGTGLPQFTPLAPGQPVPPSLVQTAPYGNCKTAPSGQQGLHPIGPVLGATAAGSACVAANRCSTTQWYTVKGAATMFKHGLLSPRIGGTYTINPDTVLRFSVGKYTQPTETAFEQYGDASGKRAANFDFSRFWGLGFHTPSHDNPVQYSNNYDFSLEKHLKGTDITAKISPFYRDTHNQIETVVLGPGFVSGTNTGHQHSYGVELGIQKGDPSRDGLAGGISYTYTKALVQYGNLPNGTNGIDYLNNYIKAFNALTSSGGGSPCYNGGTGEACPAAYGAADITNPYFNSKPQPLLARDGWYETYPNEAPNDPGDQGGNGTAIWPHQFSAWVQWKHNKFSIAPNVTIQSGAYYGSPTDIYGIDPRSCAQNQGAATNSAGAPIGVTGAAAGNCDFLTASASSFTQSGSLAIPNPYTGTFDSVGKYQQPWQMNVGAFIRYQFSPKITANLQLANIFNTCWGGTNTAWQSAFKPGRYVCGYGPANGTYLGATASQPGYGSGFYYGASPKDPANGTAQYPSYFNYPFAPFTGALPFQAYFEVEIKL